MVVETHHPLLLGRKHLVRKQLTENGQEGSGVDRNGDVRLGREPRVHVDRKRVQLFSRVPLGTPGEPRAHLGVRSSTPSEGWGLGAQPTPFRVFLF